MLVPDIPDTEVDRFVGSEIFIRHGADGVSVSSRTVEDEDCAGVWAAFAAADEERKDISLEDDS
ncbi:hypothetical protein GCM10029978_067910 [Actinoallomurus acanthiterrae]